MKVALLSVWLQGLLKRSLNPKGAPVVKTLSNGRSSLHIAGSIQSTCSVTAPHAQNREGHTSFASN